MPVLTEAERVGTTVGGKYRLDRIIGRGGVGTVFAGVHTWTGRDVAVKMLHLQHAEDRTVVDRFLTEARASAALRHPNVVDVLDMGKDDDGAVYMVLEYLEGESLSRRLERRKRLGAEETAAILLPVMDALAEAHDQAIVHRDIKPENVFLALDAKRRSVPKLLDFGIAKVLAAGSSRSTRTGTVVGTPAYMSPEQADGRSEVGPASDVWSMGVLLYECLSGVLPFPSESPTATLVAILTTSAAPLRNVAADVPASLANAVDRALSRDPAARWPDMRAFAAAVLAAVGPGGLQRPDPSGAFHAVDAHAAAVVASPTPARAVAATAAMSSIAAEQPPRAVPPTLHMRAPAPPSASTSAQPGTRASHRPQPAPSRPMLVWGLTAAGAVLLAIVALAAIALSARNEPSDPTERVVQLPVSPAPRSAVPLAPTIGTPSVPAQPPVEVVGVLPPPPVPTVSVPSTPSAPPPPSPAASRPEPRVVPPPPVLPVTPPTTEAARAPSPPDPTVEPLEAPLPTLPTRLPEPEAPPPARPPPEPSLGANDSIILD